jgi:hypothetical protein
VARSILSYDDLMSDWTSALTRVGVDLGIQWPRSTEEACEEINAFIRPDNRHHHIGSKDESSFSDPRAPDILMELYQCARAVAAGRADWSGFYAINQRYLDATSIFAESVDEVVTNRGALHRVALERMDHINGLLEHQGNLTVTIDQLNLALQQERVHREETVRSYNELLRAHEEMARRQEELEAEMASQHSLFTNKVRDLEANLEARVANYEGRIMRARAMVGSRKWLLKRTWHLTWRRNSPGDEL